MHGDAIRSVLNSLTIQTKFRVWYLPPDQLRDESDPDSHDLYRDDCLMEPYEVDASHSGRCIDYVVTDFEEGDEVRTCHVVDRPDDSVTFECHGDAIWAITVLEVGLPEPEDIYLADLGVSVWADVSKDHIDFDHNEVSCGEAKELYTFLGNWLRAKGHIE